MWSLGRGVFCACDVLATVTNKLKSREIKECHSFVQKGGAFVMLVLSPYAQDVTGQGDFSLSRRSLNMGSDSALEP